MRRFSPPDLVFNFKYSVFPNVKIVSLFLILQSLAVPFRESSYPSYPALTGWMTASMLTASLAIFALFILKELLTRKHGDKIPVRKIFAMGALIGMAKGASTEFLANLLYVKDSYPWDEIAVRAYSGAFLGIGVAFVVSLASSYNTNISKQRIDLSRKNDQIASEISLMGEEIENLKKADKEEIIDRIQKDLEPMLKNQIFNLDPEKNWRKISDSLRTAMAQKVRSQSHVIHGLTRSKTTFRTQMNRVLGFQVLNLHPRVFALIQFSIGATVVYEDWNPKNSILNLLAHTAITLIVTRVARSWLMRDVGRKRRHNFFAFFLVIFLHSVLYSLTDIFLWGNYSVFFQVSTTVWQIFLVLLISLISELIQYQNERRNLEFELNSDLTDKKRVLDYQYTLYCDEMSKYLHGFLMNKVYSTATTLESYAELKDFDQYKKEMSALLEEFSFESLMQGFEKDEVSTEFFTALQNQWDGLIQIIFDYEEETFALFLQTQKIEIAQVIEELVVNAYRHGAATLIHITFAKLEGSRKFRITARDNGLGLKQKIQPGLGSQLFHHATDGNWLSKNEEGSGAVFELTITSYEPEAEVPFLTSRE